MDRRLSTQHADGSDGSPPSEAWLFAQAVLGRPIAAIVSPRTAARVRREELERLAPYSTSHARELRERQVQEAEARRDRELLEWAALISTEAEAELRALERKEAAEQDAWRRAEQYADVLLEGGWDPSKHPRGAFPQNRGWWSPTGSSDSAGAAAVPSAPIRTADFQGGQGTARLAAFGGEQSAMWPTTGSMSDLLPKVGSGVGAGAAVAGGIGAGAFLGGLRNASMGSYWGRVPGAKAMPQVWVYELEKRVRAGTLSRDDAREIFNTAVLGAQAQGFKPTGDRMSLVHKSIMDFLGKAEAVYFARKKKKEAAGWAKQPGGYQLSGGQVFPTKQNSGLDGYALRNEQQKFFERGLAEGKDPAYLRGQAAEAGSKRAKGWGDPDDHLIDPESEAALQRAIRKSQE